MRNHWSALGLALSGRIDFFAKSANNHRASGHQKTKRLWLRKFFDHGNGIALLPDRTSAPWWQEFAPLADAVLFVSPKIKFERPDGSLGEQGRDALIRAECLGVLFRPLNITLPMAG